MKKPSPKEDQIRALKETRFTGRPIKARSEKHLLRQVAAIASKKAKAK